VIAEATHGLEGERGGAAGIAAVAAWRMEGAGDHSAAGWKVSTVGRRESRLWLRGGAFGGRERSGRTCTARDSGRLQCSHNSSRDSDFDYVGCKVDRKSTSRMC
jgi:hypothetical protein